MKRILSLILVLALIATLGITTAFAADEGFVDGKFTETRHITVEVFNRNNDGGTQPDDNVWTKYIKDAMLEKYNVDVTFVPVIRFPENEEIPKLLASKSAPDVCYTYNGPCVIEYAGMKDENGNPGILDLKPLIDENKDLIPNLYKVFSENDLFYDLDPITGNLWMIEGMRSNVSRITTFVRKDWCDKLNIALPTTEEEFYSMLVAFRDNAELLLGENADKMIPYTTSTDIGWRNDLMAVSYVPADVTDETLFVYGYDDRHLLYPGYKEGIRTLNKWYNEGLVWKDFGLYNDSTVEDDNMKSGYVGAFIHNWDYPFRNGDDSIAANLIRNVGEGAEFYPVDCFVNEAGVTLKYMGAAVGSDRKIFFPSTNKEPLASLLYVDFISSEEAIKYLQTGLEGVNYNLLENGAYEILPATGEWIKNSGNNIDYTMTMNGIYLGEATDATEALSYPGISAEVVGLAKEYGLNNGRFPKHFNVGAIEAEADVGSSLNSKRDALLTQAVTASVEDFDKVWDEGMEDYLASGGQDIIDERIEKLQEVYGIAYAE